MDIIPYLRELGLTDKEIQVFLACLERGETNAVPVARATGLPRNSAVYVLEQLKNKGLIDIVERASRKIYIAKSPRTLVTLLKQEQTRLAEKVESLESSLPTLNSLYAHNPFQPHVRIYRGRDEIRQLYEEMLQSPVNEIWYVGEYDKIIDVLGERYLREWIKRRIAKRIKTRSIRVRGTENPDALFQASKETNRQIRYAPTEFKSPGHVNIYGDNVAVVTTAKEDFGLVTTSREYAQIMQSWFQQLWKVSSER